jgi:hypothetical protein
MQYALIGCAFYYTAPCATIPNCLVVLALPLGVGVLEVLRATFPRGCIFATELPIESRLFEASAAAIVGLEKPGPEGRDDFYAKFSGVSTHVVGTPPLFPPS